MSLPLQGILVADFSRILAGPMCTAMLADLGATVVKVERPGTGDDTRGWGPPWTARSSAYFESVNRSKSSLTLDLSDAEDREFASRLASRADVLVENFRPGTLDHRGLGYDQVRGSNPGIVYCSISGFGSGAGAAIPGYDLMVQAVGGVMSLTGKPGGDATKVGIPFVDVLASKDAIIGILAALRVRSDTGEGQRVEVNLLSSLLSGLANQAASFFATGDSPHRMGNRHPSLVPYETFCCESGELVVACGNDGQFGRLAEVIGQPGLASDLRFLHNADRVAHRDELAEILRRVFAKADAASWEMRLLEQRIPAARIGTVADAFARAEALGLRSRVSLGDGNPDQVAHPIRYSNIVPVAPTRPPGLGEHDDGIRKWLSGGAGEPVSGHCFDHGTTA